MRISFSDVQRNISEIANRQEYTIDVLYELMAAYGRSVSSITKLRNGSLNLAENKNNTILQREVVYFKIVTDSKSLPAEVEKLEQDPLTQRYNPRFLIVTDLKTFAAKDIKKGNTLEIAWTDVDRSVDFFYGWTGDEITDEKTEAVADRRAADKMKELYQELEKVNLNKFNDEDANFRHHLNVFFTRLLFCFFAEDTRVFTKDEGNIFTDAIRDFTQVDGSDLDEFLATLFKSLDEEDKSAYTSPYSKFPYVNGKLFDKSFDIEIPKFNARARQLILSCGALSWAEINPDIFGSMFQGIVDEEYRSTHGMHYTSVPNIMKTIEPLFLDELREEFDKYYDNSKKLQKLHDRIAKIKVFDPACGSGNFLIIAYKELRKLEHAIIDRLYNDEFKRNALAGKLKSRIELDNFYGIEIDDFACEVAVLSLYLAKHQMNIEFEKQFGKEIKLIPLKDKANIVHGNAARLDWQEVCPNKPIKRSLISEKQQQLIITEDKTNHLLVKEEWEEIYLIGNPPYAGSSTQDEEQKEDMDCTFSSYETYRNLDYVAIWLEKGSDYLKDTISKLAFVTTNSVCQGEQVALLWPHIFDKNIEIGFAFTSFKWSNLAKNNAGVYCIVIGLRNSQKAEKIIYDGFTARRVNNINGYLANADNIIVSKESKVLSLDLPNMTYGNKPVDGGYLLLTDSEKNQLLQSHSEARILLRRFIGAREYINDIKRWCLWINDSQLNLALSIPEIKERILKVKINRLKSKDVGARKLANRPHQFRDFKETGSNTLVIPQTSSERREYIPIGLVGKEYIISNAARAVFNTEPWLFAILTSKTHMLWVRAVSGKLKMDTQYSNTLSYNTFPLKLFDNNVKKQLINSAKEILFIRENHTEKTLAEMYDPDKMPDDLREAHHKNDLLVDKLYRQKPYSNDEERLADLFKLYEEMTAKKK